MKSKILTILALALCAYLPAYATKKKKPPATKPKLQTESCELCKVLTRYSNNPEGVPPLHYAILKNDIKAIDLLLKHDADPHTGDHETRTCLYYAIKADSISLIKKFMALGNSLACLKNNLAGITALEFAVVNGSFNAAKYFITSGLFDTPKAMFQVCLYKLIDPNGSKLLTDQRKELITLMTARGLEINRLVAPGSSFLKERDYLLTREMRDFLISLGVR